MRCSVSYQVDIMHLLIRTTLVIFILMVQNQFVPKVMYFYNSCTRYGTISFIVLIPVQSNLPRIFLWESSCFAASSTSSYGLSLHKKVLLSPENTRCRGRIIVQLVRVWVGVWRCVCERESREQSPLGEVWMYSWSQV